MKRKGLKTKLLSRVREEVYVVKSSVFGHSFYQINFPSGAYSVEIKQEPFKVHSSLAITKDIVMKLRLNLARELFKGKSSKKRKIVKAEVLNI